MPIFFCILILIANLAKVPIFLRFTIIRINAPAGKFFAKEIFCNFEPRSSDRKSEMIGYPQRTTAYVDFLQTGLHHGSVVV